MEICNCVEEWSADNSMLKLQQILNASTYVAIFAIPLEFIYFIWILPKFPHKLVFIYLGNFSVLCVSTFVTKLWLYSQNLKTFLLIMIVQFVATVLSWLTVVIMFFVMPNQLRLEKKEHFLKNKVGKLSIEKSLMVREAAIRRSIVRLISEIRSTVDRQCIIKSTIVGLGQIFNLEECSLWLPSETNKTLHLCHSFSCSNTVGSVVPMSLPVVAEILNNIGAVRIPHTCPLVKESNITKRSINSEAVAIRVPLVHYSATEYDDLLDECAMSYAAMVLVLPSDDIRDFQDYELELVGAVAEQVSVALVHASAFEESNMACSHLKNQKFSTELVLKDMKIALRALEDSKVAIFHHLEMPLRALTILSSFLLGTSLAPKQREAAEMMLKNSTYLETVMQNEKYLSARQDGILQLNPRFFNLSAALNQAVDIIKPVAGVKGLSLSLVLTLDLPVYAVGDQGKLMQAILTVMSNAVKFTEEGHISVKASVAKPKTFRAWRTSQFFFVSSAIHFYLMLQVEDSGYGIDPQELSTLLQPSSTPNQHSNGKHGLDICKRLLEAMDGHIWVESDGIGKGSTTTIIVKLEYANGNDSDLS